MSPSSKPPEDWVIETFRPNQSSTNHAEIAKTRVRAHRADRFSMDDTSPSLTSLWRVTGAATQQEAMALIIEHAAGIQRGQVQLLVEHMASVRQLPPME